MARRKLAMLHAARTLEFQSSPPGNRLEALRGDRLGQHSIVEVAQVLRRYERARLIDAARAEAALRDLAALPLERYPHALLLPRAWELRENLTIYDAVYVALAELLAAPLLTGDASLAAAKHRATIELVAAR